MDFMKSLALSPDLKPIENVWTALSRSFYISGKQFDSVADLKKIIEDKWACISTTIVKPYIENTRVRCLAVIKSHGAKISY